MTASYKYAIGQLQNKVIGTEDIISLSSGPPASGADTFWRQSPLACEVLNDVFDSLGVDSAPRTGRIVTSFSLLVFVTAAPCATATCSFLIQSK